MNSSEEDLQSAFWNRDQATSATDDLKANRIIPVRSSWLWYKMMDQNLVMVMIMIIIYLVSQILRKSKQLKSQVLQKKYVLSIRN